MTNPVMPKAHRILHINHETEMEYTFRIEADFVPEHGQFFQLSVPRVGECPISVSSFGEGWLEFTIRAVGKVTDELFSMRPGDEMFLRGPYGKGWPVEELRGKHLVFVTGGTGLAPVKSWLNKLYDEPEMAESVHLIAGFKNEAGILFKPDLARWKERFSTHYTLDNDQIEGWNTGLVTKFIPEIPFDTFGGNYAVIIVGPPVMMHFAALEAVKCGVPEEKIWVSFERKMSCAVGKCGHCRIDEVYVCLDGPVFPYTVARDLVD